MKPANKRDDGKHGRTKMRKVTRTSRRGPVDSLERELDQDKLDADSEPEQSDEESLKHKSTNDNGTMAYNALLTLLSSEHKPNNKAMQRTGRNGSGQKSVDIQESHEEANSDSEQEIVGLNLNEDQNDKDQDALDDDNDMQEFDMAEDAENDSDDEVGDDPFHVHFNQVSEDYIEAQHKLSEKWPVKSKTLIEKYNSIFQVPPGTPINTSNTTKPIQDLAIKKRVLQRFLDQEHEDASEVDQHLLSSMTQYKDITFPYFNYKNQLYKKLYALHALNHIYKTRDTILKNTGKLRNYEEQLKQGKTPQEVEFRDQGFTRPKVLILLPTREACFDIVNLLMKYSSTDQQENKKRFTNQFHGNGTPPDSKPEDFRYYFKGNTNDFFTMGIKFTRKSLKLYSSFYSSDIIVASPIGLSMILENPDKRKREHDFLSSIEVLIVDYANQLEMQNWDHVLTVLKYVNKVPKKFHDADFSRIRMWSINDRAKYLTQRLVFAEYLTPNVNNVVNKSSNLAGRLKFKRIIDSNNCVMNSVGLKIKQIFQRFESSSPLEDPEARFKFFTNSLINSVSNSTSYDDGLLIIIPSYFDYIRVKDFMYNNTKVTFDAIDEYSSQSHLTKARQQFISGKIKVLVYSERLHHFRRFEIAGVKNVLLYGVPTNPLFYKEYLRFIGKSVFNNLADINLSFIKIIYSKWDAIGLERIIGRERAPVLCNSANEMYEFK